MSVDTWETVNFEIALSLKLVRDLFHVGMFHPDLFFDMNTFLYFHHKYNRVYFYLRHSLLSWLLDRDPKAWDLS